MIEGGGVAFTVYLHLIMVAYSVSYTLKFPVPSCFRLILKTISFFGALKGKNFGCSGGCGRNNENYDNEPGRRDSCRSDGYGRVLQ